MLACVCPLAVKVDAVEEDLLGDGVSLALTGGKELVKTLGALGTREGGVLDEGLELGTLGAGKSGLDGLEVGLDLLEGLGVLGEGSDVGGGGVLACDCWSHVV